jgi:hypothetical protein
MKKRLQYIQKFTLVTFVLHIGTVEIQEHIGWEKLLAALSRKLLYK